MKNILGRQKRAKKKAKKHLIAKPNISNRTYLYIYSRPVWTSLWKTMPNKTNQQMEIK